MRHVPDMWHRRWWVLLAAVLMLSVNAGAAERVTLVLDTTLELAGAGLRMRPLKGFATRPLPAVTTQLYENRDTGERLEAYDPLALWKHDQHEALFIGREGQITVAAVKYEPLGTMRLVNQQHVTREVYDATLKEHADAEWGDADYQAWLQRFTGWSVKSVNGRVRGAQINYPYRFYTFNEIEPTHGVAWIVRLPEGRGHRYLAFVFTFHPQYEIRNMAAVVLNCMESVKATERAAANLEPSRRFQSRDSAGGQSAQFEQTRQRVIENIRNLKDWWYVETTNYVICSNMPRNSRRMVDAIQADIEILRRAFERFLPPMRPIEEVSVVRVFADRQEYVDYVPKQVEWSGGVWMPAKKELVISPPQTEQAQARSEATLAVVYHEAFHQYAHYALDQRMLPTWFDEGHAAFFESATVDRRRETLEIGEHAGWAELLDRLVEQRQLNFEAVVRMKPEQFYGANREVHYAHAWGLIYFLHKAGPQFADQRYAQSLRPVVEAVQGRKSYQQASEAFLSGVDMRQLLRDFEEFWKSRTARRRAERFDVLR